MTAWAWTRGVLLQTLLIALYLALPAGVIYLCLHQRWLRHLGVVVCCYLLGLSIGLGGLIPVELRVWPARLSEVTLVMALPLLLFSLDLRQWTKVAGKALLSLLFAVVSVSFLASLLFFLYRDQGDLAADLAAMSVGVYSGGTPNLAAIKAGLDIPDARYLAFHSLDTLVGSAYLLFMLTLGVPLFRALLPATRASHAPCGDQPASDSVDEDDYRPLLLRANWPQILAALLLSLLVVGLSFVVAAIVAGMTGGGLSSAVLIISLTTLGILCSLHPRVRQILLSYRVGMYLIYVFCLAVASMVSIEDLRNLDATVGLFLLVVVFAGLALHLLLCRLAGVDSDTFMVTSVAAVASPPFVPLMARALNNPAAILPGMTTGVIGYALGSYLGISLGLYLQSL